MVRHLVLHTAIGAAATLAVAVAAACWVPFRPVPPLRGLAMGQSRDRLPEPDLGKREGAIGSGLLQTPGVDRWTGWGIDLRAATLDVADLYDEMQDLSPGHYRGPVEVRVGWPFRFLHTLADHAIGGPDYEPSVASGFALHGWGVRASLPPPGAPSAMNFSRQPNRRRGGPWAIIPWRPEPLPLAVDVAFWGLLSRGVFAGFAAVRRERRRRRGVCPGCGYPLPDRGTCPECGPTLG